MSIYKEAFLMGEYQLGNYDCLMRPKDEDVIGPDCDNGFGSDGLTGKEPTRQIFIMRIGPRTDKLRGRRRLTKMPHRHSRSDMEGETRSRGMPYSRSANWRQIPWEDFRGSFEGNSDYDNSEAFAAAGTTPVSCHPRFTFEEITNYHLAEGAKLR